MKIKGERLKSVVNEVRFVGRYCAGYFFAIISWIVKQDELSLRICPYSTLKLMKVDHFKSAMLGYALEIDICAKSFQANCRSLIVVFFDNSKNAQYST